MLTVTSLFQSTVAKYPERLALLYGEMRLTYAEWNMRIGTLACGLFDLGVRRRDRVALLLKASDASPTAYMACQLLGAVAVPLNHRASAAEAAHMIQDSGARVLIYEDALSAVVAKSARLLPRHCIYVRVGRTPGGDAAATALPHHDFDALLNGSTSLLASSADIVPEDTSALIYTSGTTGRAKGAIHTHANDVAIAMNCVMEYSLTCEDIALHIAPLHHVGGMQAFFLPHLMVGGANVLSPAYSPEGTLSAIAENRITTLFAVPTQIQDMLLHPDLANRDLSSLRLVTTGGAPLARATMERAIQEFCAKIYNGYGMTEASLTLLLRPRDALTRLGSCGKPTLISTCRLIKPDPDRSIVAADVTDVEEVGELLVKGPQMVRGYWNNPVETAKRFKDGWLYTGDLFHRDGDGYFYFRGRIDDMIVSGGENIYPREVEEVLYRCPGVQEAAVIGAPDEKWGQAVTAFVVRHDNALDEAAVLQFCKSSDALPAYKCPKRVLFLDSLPTNPSGKVLRYELAQLLANA